MAEGDTPKPQRVQRGGRGGSFRGRGRGGVQTSHTQWDASQSTESFKGKDFLSREGALDYRNAKSFEECGSPFVSWCETFSGRDYKMCMCAQEIKNRNQWFSGVRWGKRDGPVIPVTGYVFYSPY